MGLETEKVGEGVVEATDQADVAAAGPEVNDGRAETRQEFSGVFDADVQCAYPSGRFSANRGDKAEETAMDTRTGSWKISDWAYNFSGF